MVPAKTGGFKYERPTPSRVGFYLWLEATKPAIGAERALTVLEYCNTPLIDRIVEPAAQLPDANVPKHQYRPRRKHK